ncbi:hypothetical protein H7H51_23635 [Mycolicibacterium farcinogenes]|nr:hypothetical protein [Mycolicibacterium farcinogenes]
MSPASGPGPSLTRSKIENWDIDHLESSATRWRTSADEFEELFSRHRQNISGTDWEGTAKDTALDRVSADTAVVDRHGEVVRAAADLAATSVTDLRAAQQAVLTAIAEAEADGFRVAEDLSVTDGRRYDITTIQDRNRALAEHADNIQWNARQLLAADTLIGERLTAKASELDGITFDGEGRDDRDVVQAVEHKQGPAGLGDMPADSSDPWPYPWDIPAPPDSRPGGGRWEIDFDHPYQGDGSPTGTPPPSNPWHNDIQPPLTGHPSGFHDVVTPPPNGWGATPGWNLRGAYRFRMVGEGFNGSPEHMRWVQRDGNWYPATWIGYEYEVEHQYVLIPQNDGAGLLRPAWGAGVWKPTGMAGIYQAYADNPRLPLYIPDRNGGIYQFPGKTPGALGG